MGSNGTILKTKDGGEIWAKRPSGTSTNFQSVTFTNDGNTGWVVGQDVILLTANGGKTWRQLNADDDYRKYPAPWTWIVFIFAMLALLPTFQPLQSKPQGDSIANHFISDRPISAGDPDPLQRGLIANTLSRFLRNENTEPPMTIAITGNWGEGKSSLMNLLKADLEKHGTKTVWFNAWHHQKEQHLFAALLQAVRDQAIPGLLSVSGIPFRMRLVWSRARSHQVRVIFVLALFGLFAGFIVNAIESVPYPYTLDRWIRGVSSLGMVVIFLIVAYKTLADDLKGSGFNPGRLMAAASSTFRVKAFSDQLGFRHRFGEAFKEVAEALRPYTLLILIDDLDRCRPEQVVETLEAMNFLVSAGPCYVVIGIAPEQVMHCVGLGFKEIAAEIAEMPGSSKAPNNTEAWGREKRRYYARNYLEKLINIELPIPKLTDKEANDIVNTVNCLKRTNKDASKNPESKSNEGRTESLRVLRHFTKVLATWVAVFAILSAGFYIGSVLFGNSPPTIGSEQPSRSVQDKLVFEPKRSQDEKGSSPEQDPPEKGGDGTFRKGTNDGVPWWSSLLPAGLLVFAMVAIAIYTWRRQEDRTQDSTRFTDALNIWHPLIRATTNSPRQIKRFMNRVRYFATASRENGGQEHLSASEIVMLAALEGLNRDVTPENEEQSLIQPLVSLLIEKSSEPDGGAEFINTRFEEMLKNRENERKLKNERIQEIREVLKKLAKGLADHRKKFPGEKVTPDLVTQFRKMDSGIVVR